MWPCGRWESLMHFPWEMSLCCESSICDTHKNWKSVPKLGDRGVHMLPFISGALRANLVRERTRRSQPL
jgi:hypothetical protein